LDKLRALEYFVASAEEGSFAGPGVGSGYACRSHS
jgi:hypothetical protein